MTEQYIKPVTALAGKMSWALMMNPKGLDCDLLLVLPKTKQKSPVYKGNSRKRHDFL